MLALKALLIGAPAALREQLEAITGKMALVRHLAALRRGPLTTTTASARARLRALAPRRLDLHAEIAAHDAPLGQLTERCAPGKGAGHGLGNPTRAAMGGGGSARRPLAQSAAGPAGSPPRAARPAGTG